MLVKVLLIVYAGLQLVFKRSKHISPVLRLMFGWQMGVEKVIVGGVRGYVGGIMMSSSHCPPGLVF
jgi:hypothetical protein